jgi:hypothetical protein
MPTHMNRRAILAGAAALPVASVPALAATEPDPIFAAIEARKATIAAYNAGKWDDDEALDGVCDADAEAVRQMVSTTPTTLRRLRDLVRYVAECETGGDEILELFMTTADEESGLAKDALLATLAAALNAMVRQAAA